MAVAAIVNPMNLPFDDVVRSYPRIYPLIIIRTITMEVLMNKLGPLTVRNKTNFLTIIVFMIIDLKIGAISPKVFVSRGFKDNGLRVSRHGDSVESVMSWLLRSRIRRHIGLTGCNRVGTGVAVVTRISRMRIGRILTGQHGWEPRNNMRF